MRVNEDYATWNAANQVNDELSVRAFWRRLLKIRKEHIVLVGPGLPPYPGLPLMTETPRQIAGDFQELAHDHERIFAFVRRLDDQLALVVLNFGNDDAVVQLDSLPFPWSSLQLEIGNYLNKGDGTITDGAIELKGFEGRLYFSR